ncbi:uncharacterized protein [Hyperolius riggenbachi]|uniref:uncharacterized protein n=1 Tax=Hyperolius riggenbachi TaxID=752182 RepID=UPI0035A2C206
MEERGSRGEGAGAMARNEMAQSGFSTEELIVRVQEHPELYDKGHAMYKDAHRTRLVWMRITKVFYEDEWSSLSDAQKDRKMKDIKTRWRSIKDNFLRELKAEKNEARSGAGASRRTPYRFKDHLNFLRPVLEPRLSEDNIDMDDNSGAMDISEENEDSTQATEVSDCTIVSELSEANTPVAGCSTSAGNTASVNTVRNVSSAPPAKSVGKKKENDELVMSLRSCVQYMGDQEKMKNPAYTLAVSLVPLIEEVPKRNMIRLRHALLDAIKTCIPDASDDQTSVAVDTSAVQSGTVVHQSQRNFHNQPGPAHVNFACMPSTSGQMYSHSCPPQTHVQNDQRNVHHMLPNLPYMQTEGTYGQQSLANPQYSIGTNRDVQNYRAGSTPPNNRMRNNTSRDESLQNTSAALTDSMFFEDL